MRKPIVRRAVPEPQLMSLYQQPTVYAQTPQYMALQQGVPLY